MSEYHCKGFEGCPNFQYSGCTFYQNDWVKDTRNSGCKVSIAKIKKNLIRR